MGTPEQEDIPHSEDLSRLIEKPRHIDPTGTGFLWDVVFEFPKGQPESLVWRKYAATQASVHRLGCELQGVWHRRGRTQRLYCGFITATVGSIRGVRTPSGHGIELLHEPENGAIEHVHVYLVPAYGGAYNTIPPTDKADLKYRLGEVFGGLVPHSCASPPASPGPAA